MHKVKAFPYVFFHSLSSISYYKEILKTRFSFSIKYFLLLAALVSTISTLNLSIKITPIIRETTQNVLAQFRNIYPSDLVITSKNNEWAINKPQPVVLPFPIFKDDVADFPKNFIVFDKNGTVADVTAHDTLVLVNEKNILVHNTRKLEVYPIKEIPDGQFTKQRLDQALDNLEKLMELIEFIVVLFLALVIIFYNFIFRLIYLIFVGAFIWVLGHIVESKYKLSQAYRIGIHTMTLPIVVQLMIETAGIKFNMPLWFLFLNLIFAAVVVLALAQGEKHTRKTAHATKE